jgi:hypothetical protein
MLRHKVYSDALLHMLAQKHSPAFLLAGAILLTANAQPRGMTPVSGDSEIPGGGRSNMLGQIPMPRS